MRKFIVLIAGLFIFSFIAHSQSPKKVYKTGVEFYNSKNYNDAIEQFTEAIELKTDYVDAYVKRAESYMAIDKAEDAVDDYRRALAFDDNNEDLYYDAGIIYYELKNDSLAIEMLNEVLAIKRSYIQTYPYLVKLYLRNDNKEKGLAISKQWVSQNRTELSYYYEGIAYDSLKQFSNSLNSYSNSIKMNSKFIDGYIAKSRSELNLSRYAGAYTSVNKAISLDKNNVEAYVLKSEIGIANKDFPNAINDISRAIVLEPDNKELYIKRGFYNMQFSQYSNAISDFNKVIVLDPENPEGYYYRAQANAETGNIKQAIDDYERFEELSPGVVGLSVKLTDVRKQLYELNKESNNPELVLIEPAKRSTSEVQVSKSATEIRVAGKIEDQSLINKIEINGKEATFEPSSLNPNFELFLSLPSVENELRIVVTDIYFNVLVQNFKIIRTEVEPPVVSLRAPVSSENNEIYIDVDSPQLYIEGKINDDSKISVIRINDMLASYPINEPNPVFSATISISNINTISVYAEDEFGNGRITEFAINRDAVGILADNPMGKTWVIFIENSDYEEFASLVGPEKDITAMRSSLTNYKISNFVHKKDMSKEDMERFFSIELRDLVRANQVNSLLVWYAGHGKFINQTGYWIPIDAKRDDEFSYFNVNVIKSALQSYYTGLTHTLVINDACESGASFADLTRGENTDRRCENWQDVRSKSSQVFTSAGYELAIDNSQFTKTFANVLINNTDACIPIDVIVKSVKQSVKQNNNQTPKFGVISGLGDENGTFFFIKK
jgi:tetratricopeptide (TPR) repeat protein